MNWTDTLNRMVDETYKAAEGLLDHVDPDGLDWKPETGDNWMTTGQLILHLTNACGLVCKGFVTGEWGMPEEGMSDDDMLPSADRMPTAESVDAVRAALAADKAVAKAMIAEAGEADLASREVSAPWNPTPRALGYQLTECVAHLASHKSQLFYYLKLQGKPVNTMHLWGME